MAKSFWDNEESLSYGQEYIDMLVDDIDILIVNKEDLTIEEIKTIIFPALDMTLALVQHCPIPSPAKAKMDFWQAELKDFLQNKVSDKELSALTETLDQLILNIQKQFNK